MSMIYTKLDVPELEKLMDEWSAVNKANNNGWAKLFNTAGYQKRKADVLAVQRKLDTYFRNTYPKGIGWGLKQVMFRNESSYGMEHKWLLTLQEDKE